MIKICFVLLAIELQSISCQSNRQLHSNRFPDKLKLVFRYSKRDNFTFNLKKIQDNVDKTKVVVGDNRGVHEEKQDPNKHYSMYRDTKLHAVFTVTHDNRVDNKKGYSYYGSFRYNNHIYSLEPVYPGESRGENVFNRDYIIQIHGIKYHLRERDERFHGGVDNTAVSKSDSTVVNPNKKGTDKKFIGQKQLMTIEVLVILDYSIFTKWMRLVNNDKQEAVENMKYYYSEILNGVKMRYEGINLPNYMFTVALTGFYIAEASDKAPFTEDKSIKSNNVVNSHKALNKLSTWIKSAVIKELPRFDVAALFTNYEMGSINGLAYLTGVCMSSGVSINRDSGPFHTADTAAHEIGHNLGSRHDSDNNTCSYEDQYIMASGRSSLNQHNYDNPFQFSYCSLNYFIDRINKLNTKNENCLEDYPTSDKPLHADKYLKSFFGQTYSLDFQCKIVVDARSYVCSRGEETGHNICLLVPCYSHEEGRCLYMRPANRTSCGLHSWCVRGRCIKDENAPKFRDKCLFGDTTTPIEIKNVKMNCKDLTERYPILCREESYRYSCCDSCDKLEDKENKNCPFGDLNEHCDYNYCRSPYYRIVCCRTCKVNSSEKFVQSRCEEGKITDWCKSVESYSCLHLQDLCCAQCAKFYDPSAKGCEYGDQGNWCSERVRVYPEDCKKKSISDTCCKSCKGVTASTKKPKKPKTTTPRQTPKPSGCQDKDECKGMQARHCYMDEFRDRCCETCQRQKISDDEKCKYGDHSAWCRDLIASRKDFCKDNNYLTTCCHACKNYRRN